MSTPIRSEAEPQTPPTEKPGSVGVNVTENPQPQTRLPEERSPIKSTTPTINQGTHQARNEASATGTVLTPEERARKKARLATVLDRGVVQDRLEVKLPPDVYGEWVRDDPLEIHRLRTMGFEIDREHAPNQSLHNDGTGAARVADVVFMTTTRENKELIDEIRHEQMMRLHDPRKGREERELQANIAAESGGDVPTFTESQTHSARTADVAAALREADAQIKPIT
jgi:hypothetical protein